MLLYILGNGYSFTMPGPPEELMTRENLISRELYQKSPTYGHVTKLFLESEFQHKANKQMENVNSKQDIAVFSAATDSEHKIIQILHRKYKNKMWTELSSLGQEHTFKLIQCATYENNCSHFPANISPCPALPCTALPPPPHTHTPHKKGKNKNSWIWILCHSLNIHI